jgi:hypothetical protein
LATFTFTVTGWPTATVCDGGSTETIAACGVGDAVPAAAVLVCVGVRVGVRVGVGVFVGHTPGHGVGVGGTAICTEPPAVAGAPAEDASGWSRITPVRDSRVCPALAAVNVTLASTPLPSTPGKSAPSVVQLTRTAAVICCGGAHCTSRPEEPANPPSLMPANCRTAGS